MNTFTHATSMSDLAAIDEALKRRGEMLDLALSYMEMGLEPTSALKQAGSDYGIPFGDEMGAFVTWALDHPSMRTSSCPKQQKF